jgi:hypothetical protein
MTSPGVLKSAARGDYSPEMEYFTFLIGELNDTIRYSDSKHTVGMSLVVSILLASHQLLFARLDMNVYLVRLMLDIHVGAGLFAMAFGYMGIFPKFISPSFSWKKRSKAKPNLFFFKEISQSDINVLRATVEEAFPDSSLSKSYREHAVIEVYALSQIAMRKFTTFRLFLYALFFYLVTMGWLFLTSLLDLSASRG